MFGFNKASTGTFSIITHPKTLVETPIYSFSVNENTDESSAVGKVKYTPPLNSDSVIGYVLQSSSDSILTISSDGNLAVARAAEVNFEEASTHSTTVHVIIIDKNSGARRYESAKITVQIGNHDGMPVESGLPESVTSTENNIKGAEILEGGTGSDIITKKIINYKSDNAKINTITGPDAFKIDENSHDISIFSKTGAKFFIADDIYGRPITLELMGDYAEWFIIDENGLMKARKNKNIDYELVESSYVKANPGEPFNGNIKLRVVAMVQDGVGSGNISGEKIITITINDVDDAPVLSFENEFGKSNDIIEIDEHYSLGTAIATFNTSDPDGEYVYLSIVNTDTIDLSSPLNHGNIFQIFKNKLYVTNPALLDYETLGDSFELKVEGYSIPGDQITQIPITINLKDIIEIVEGSTGKLTILDIENIENYSIVNDDMFELKTTTDSDGLVSQELWLKADQELDHENKNTHTFTLIPTVTDSELNRTPIEIKLYVTNVKITLNANYKVETGARHPIIQLSNAGDKVVSFDAPLSITKNNAEIVIDKDDDYVVTFQLFGEFSKFYIINPETGTISLKNDLNGLKSGTHYLTVKAIVNEQVEGVKELSFEVNYTKSPKIRPFEIDIDTPIRMTSNDIQIDEDGDTFIFKDTSEVEFVRSGEYSVTNGNLIWTPKDGFVGEDTLTLDVVDSRGGKSVQIVKIFVGRSLNINNGDDFIAFEDYSLLVPSGNFKILNPKGLTIDYQLTVDGNVISSDNLKIVGKYGTLTVNTKGEWLYVVDQELVNDLDGDGSSVAETFKVTYFLPDDTNTLKIDADSLFGNLNIKISGKTDIDINNTLNTDDINKNNSTMHLSLHGNSNANVFYGGNGDDVLNGLSGNDDLNGGSGNDVLNGGSGDDKLYGGIGSDILSGGLGKDILSGGIGSDKFVLLERALSKDLTDNITDFSEGDLLVFASGTKEIWIQRVYDTKGNWTDLKILSSDNEQDSLVELKGWGKWLYSRHLSDPDIDIKLYGENDNDNLFGGDGDDTIYGGYGDDLLEGQADNDLLVGNYGNDIMRGGNGNDRLFGNTGNDIMDGGDGNDTLIGGAGADEMDGGAGSDILSYFGSKAGVTVNLGTKKSSGGHADGDTFENFEHLFGSAIDDNLTGDSRANVISGGKGDDIITGGGGADRLYGDAGEDIFVLRAEDIGTKTQYSIVSDYKDGEDLILIQAGGKNVIKTAHGDHTVLWLGDAYDEVLALIENITPDLIIL